MCGAMLCYATHMTNATRTKTTGSIEWLNGIPLDALMADILTVAHWSDYYADEYVALVDANMECIMFDDEDEAREKAVELGQALKILGGWSDDDDLLAEAVARGDNRDDLWHLMDEAYEVGTEVGVMEMLGSSTAIGFREMKAWATKVFETFNINLRDDDVFDALMGVVDYVEIPSRA